MLPQPAWFAAEHAAVCKIKKPLRLDHKTWVYDHKGNQVFGPW